MSWVTQVRNRAVARAAGQQQRNPDYALGPAGIPMDAWFWGADPSKYVPDEFGKYILTSNPVYACVSQRANYLSSLPLRLFRMTGESAMSQLPRDDGSTIVRDIIEMLDKYRGPISNRMQQRNAIAAISQCNTREMLQTTTRKLGLEEVSEGPAFDLLHFVNDFWTNQRLIRMTSLCRDLWGQSYWVVNRGPDGRGEPEEIWWVKPTQMRPIPHPTLYISHYEFDPLNGGEPIPFFPWETVRIYNANPLDEFQPLSALSSTSIYADHEKASMRSNMNLHDQGLSPGAVLMPANKMTWEDDQAKELEEDINRRLSGVDRAHRWAVLRQEVIMDRSAITPEEAQYLEGMGWDVEAVARGYDWPIDLLAGKRTYENVEMAFKRAWQTVAMEGAFVASDIAEFFLPMFNIGDEILVPYFDTTNIAVLQETENVRWERERSMIDVVIKRNEWRAARGLDPVDGGDTLYIPVNMVPLESAGEQSPVADETPLLEPGDDDEDGDQVEEMALVASNGARR